MSESGRAGLLSEFAETHGLEPGAGEDLPKVGTVLDRSNKHDSAVHGVLPGGMPGALLHLTYERRSDDRTYTEELTAVVLRVPESIGFAPYLAGGDSSHVSVVLDSERREIGTAEVRVDSGVDESWLTELLSPALADWIARSPSGFGFELADGILTVVLDGHQTSAEKLERLCNDAAYLAGAIRREALEDSSGGQAKRTAARKKAELRDIRVEKLVPHVIFASGPPRDVTTAAPAYQSILVRAPVTYLGSALTALWITLAISIVAGGIYGLLLTVGDPLINALVWEGGLYLIVLFFVLRSRINGDAKACAEEAFYREYAKARGLEAADPLEFAAVHAEAGLPGRPVRVMTGAFTGPAGTVSGGLMLTGDGQERGQPAALVAGPKGPTAVAELNPSAPGVSAAYLDELTQTLLLDLATTPDRS
jgi:hypothetical protein